MPKKRLTDAFIKRVKPPTGTALDYWDTAVRALGLRVSPKGRRSWNLKVQVKGSQQRYALGIYPAVTLAAARRKANDIISAIEKGDDPKGDARKREMAAKRTKANTFTALAGLYLTQHVAKLRSGGEVERAFNSDLIPAFGDMPVTEITRADIHKVLDAKALKSPVMANRLQSYLSRFFNWAVDREYIDTNPCHRMQCREDERRRRRDRVLTDDELGLIWHAADSLGYPFGQCFQVMLLTGQRRGEVAGMAWSELDLDGASWTIPKARMKADTAHTVPLSPQTVALLQSVPAIDDIDLLFTKVFTTKEPRPISGFGKAKTRLDTLSGVTGWRLHDLRRTFATGCRRLGADRLTVSKLLHHTDASVTGIYDHFALTEAQQTAVDAWGNHVAGIIKKERKRAG